MWRYGDVVDPHTYRHVTNMHHAATAISVDGATVAYQVHSVLNHHLAERVAMLSLAVFSFEEPAIAFHLKKDEAGLGVTTLWSRELLLISEHDLPRFQFFDVESWWLGLRGPSLDIIHHKKWPVFQPPGCGRYGAPSLG